MLKLVWYEFKLNKMGLILCIIFFIKFEKPKFDVYTRKDVWSTKILSFVLDIFANSQKVESSLSVKNV